MRTCDRAAGQTLVPHFPLCPRRRLVPRIAALLIRLRQQHLMDEFLDRVHPPRSAEVPKEWGDIPGSLKNMPASAHVGLHGGSHCFLNTAFRRSTHDRIAVTIHTTTRSSVGLPGCPRMWPRGHVLPVHQNRRRPQVDGMRRAFRVLAVPLGPDRGHTCITAHLSEDLAGEIHVRAAGIEHELDVKLQAQW